MFLQFHKIFELKKNLLEIYLLYCQDPIFSLPSLAWEEQSLQKLKLLFELSA